MYIHVFLAFFWLMVAIVILAVPEDAPIHIDQARRPIFVTIALFFFGFNLLRWWMGRRRSRRTYQPDEPPPVRQHVQQEPRNPDFDFSDEADRKEEK